MKGLVVLFFLFAATIGIGPEVAAQDGPRPVYAPGEVLVKFRPQAASADIASVKSQLRLDTLKIFKRITVHHLKIRSNLTVEQAISRLRQSPFVEYAEANYYRYVNAVPNDPRYPEMWGLNNTGQTGGTPGADIDAQAGWNITTGSSNVVVALIDSGTDVNHQDLAANIWTNPGEIPGNGIDDDGNGFVDDVRGWDFRDNDNDPTDTSATCSGHGTHTAGTIGAVGNNGIGVTGVNWNVKIMPLRVFGGFFCSGADSQIISAIEYYTDFGIRFSSNSYGGGPFNQAAMDAIRASQSVFVAAAGNENRDNDVTPNYPSNYELDSIIAVAATDDTDARASFSNFGLNSVDLGAPGVDILSTIPGDNYGLLSGTSMATPHVAGAVGLLLAQDPGLTNNEIKFRILNGTDASGLPVLTGGRLNVRNALNFGLLPPGVEVHVTPVGSTTVSPGGTISYNVVVHNHSAGAATVTAKVYVRSPAGQEMDLNGPFTFPLAAAGSVTQTFSKTVPATVGLGSYTIFGQAETATSFDEDPVEYQVVP